MPASKRRGKQRLLEGRSSVDDALRFSGEGALVTLFGSLKAAEAAWQDRRSVLLARCRPWNRPEAYWTFEAPELAEARPVPTAEELARAALAGAEDGVQAAIAAFRRRQGERRRWLEAHAEFVTAVERAELEGRGR